jgi:(p)ppGpp synthase/HD superfamily hydrolase
MARSNDDALYIQKIAAFARKIHSGQTDQQGEPYYRHLSQTSAILQTCFPNASADEIATAYTHDSLEDRRTTVEGLIAAGARQRTIDITIGLTRPAGKTYRAWIEIMAKTQDAGLLMIKYADNLSNSDPLRWHPRYDELQRNRYAPARLILTSALHRLGITPLRPAEMFRFLSSIPA